MKRSPTGYMNSGRPGLTHSPRKSMPSASATRTQSCAGPPVKSTGPNLHPILARGAGRYLIAQTTYSRGTVDTVTTGRGVRTIAAELMSEYGFSEDDAYFILNYTAADKKRPSKEWKLRNGFITIRYHGRARFTLEDHRETARKIPERRVAIHPRMAYTPEGKGNPAAHPVRRDTHMPPARGRRSAPAPAPAPAPEPEENGQVDYQKYLDKELSPTMTDYVTWFEDNVAQLEDVPVDKLLVLGSSLYPHFQKSDFNIERREARRAERAPAPEPEPAKPAARGGRSRRAAAPEPEPEPEPAPAPARRGRGRTAAKAGAEAPY